MATTISGPVVTDDTGTPAAPNNDGTLFDKAFWDSVYAAINAMWSGSTQVFGGVLTAEGFGTHTFSAGGTGLNAINVVNTDAGATNVAAVRIGNDNNANRANVSVFSSTFTTAAPNFADGALLQANGSGGLTLQGADASGGDIRIYARGSTKRIVYDGDKVFVDSPDAGSYQLAGVLDASVNTNNVGTDANTTEKDLHTFSLPADSLSIDGQMVHFRWSGVLANNTNTKTVRAYFGSTVLVTLVNDANQTDSATWTVEVEIVRTGAATQKVIAVAYTARDNANNILYSEVSRTDPTETLSGAVTIKLTGQNGVGTASDIVCQMSRGLFLP